MNKAKLELLKEWIYTAEVDLKTSKQLLRSENEILTESICFHCQQCAEKYLKVFLIFHDYNPPKVHDLERLVELCANFDNEFRDLDTGNLTDYGVSVRYADFFVPSLLDAQESLEIAEKVKEFVNTKIGII